MEEPLLDLRVVDRARHFHTFLRVPCHHVRRADIDFRIRTVPEHEHPGMLQIPPYDARHPEILCLSRYPGKDTADSPDDQVDLHSCTGRLRHLMYEINISDRVHLHQDPSAAPFCDLLVHQFKDLLL